MVGDEEVSVPVVQAAPQKDFGRAELVPAAWRRICSTSVGVNCDCGGRGGGCEGGVTGATVSGDAIAAAKLGVAASGRALVGSGGRKVCSK